MNSRSTTCVLSDVYLVQYLPFLAPFSHAGSGLPPSGTTPGASGAAQSTPGCLVRKETGDSPAAELKLFYVLGLVTPALHIFSRHPSVAGTLIRPTYRE